MFAWQVHSLCLPEESSISVDDSLVQVAQVEAEGDEITEQLPPAIRVEDADGAVREAGIADNDDDDGVGHQAVEAEAGACADLVAQAKEVDSVVNKEEAAPVAAVIEEETTEALAVAAEAGVQIDAADKKIVPDATEQEPEVNSVIEEASFSLVKPAMSIPRIEVTDDDSGEVSLAPDEEVPRPPETAEESRGGDDTAAPLRRYDASFGVPDMVVTAPGPNESETSSEKDAVQAV